MTRVRIVVAGVGIGLAIVAIATSNQLVTWAAIVALIAALALRLLKRGREG